ncbi:MAG: DUF2157 domain-containing protein [Burkholderiales bacterium]|nr:DUF2157 domain-containing protein [Burkholderiales bacterium]
MPSTPIGASTFAARRNWLDSLVAGGRLPGAQLQRARRALALIPDGALWQRLIATVLAGSGIALWAAALVFTVAFNWDALGHFSRFALVETCIALCVAATLWRGVDHAAGEALLIAACLGVGALLALFGQTYQTGADPWSLFFVWALLLLPWLLAARRAAAWILWIVVANLALGLYCEQVLGHARWMRLLRHFDASALLALALNGALLVAFERLRWLGGAGLQRAVPRLLALLTLTAAAAVLVAWIVTPAGRSDGIVAGAAGALAAAVALAAMVRVYLLRRDLVILSAAALATISVGYAILTRMLELGDAFGFFTLSAGYWIGMITGAVVLLRGIGVDGTAKGEP